MAPSGTIEHPVVKVAGLSRLLLGRLVRSWRRRLAPAATGLLTGVPPDPGPSWDALLDMAQGYQPSLVILAANEVGLFERLGTDSLTPGTLAEELQLEPEVVTLVLDALLGLGLLSCRGDTFQLVPRAQEVLLPGGPRYCGGMLRHELRQARTWLGLVERLQRGRLTARQSADLGPGSMLEAMVDLWRLKESWLLRSLDLCGRRRLLDLGGGPGSYTICLLRRYPELTATIVDLPSTLQFTRRLVAQTEDRVASRITLLERDVLREKDLQGPYDCALISQFLHGFPRPTAEALLRLVARHLDPGGRLCVLDYFKEIRTEAGSRGALFSINMAVCAPAGQAYTSDELRRMLTTTGYGEIQKIAPASPREPGMMVSVLGR